MRKIFIDGGANTGISVQLFRQKYPQAESFEIHSFECNPKLLSKFKQSIKEVTLHEKALSTKDGVANFYIGNSLSSTLRTDKTSGGIQYSRPIQVATVDLANFIKSNFSKEDYIILKLDVEGAEYDIIPHLLKEDIFSGWVDELFGEWHPGKLTEVSKEDHTAIVEQLSKKGFKMKDWCAEKGKLEL